MSGISASREKTDFTRTLWISADQGRREKLTIRCNRMILPLRNRRGEEKIVVRGKTLTGTLRMAVSVLDTYRLRGTVTEPDSVSEVTHNWAASLPTYEMEYTPENWVALYCNGSKLFSNADSPEMDTIERLARGGPIEDPLLGRNLDAFQREEDEVAYVTHDSQLAVVLNNQERFVKTAILERGITSDGAFSFALYRRRKTRGTMIEALAVAASIVEANVLRTQYNLMKARKANVTGEELIRIGEQMNAAVDRVKELNQALTVTKQNNQMQFWPDEPRFNLG